MKQSLFRYLPLLLLAAGWELAARLSYFLTFRWPIVGLSGRAQPARNR